jgi:hypothetical protein
VAGGDNSVQIEFVMSGSQHVLNEKTLDPWSVDASATVDVGGRALVQPSQHGGKFQRTTVVRRDGQTGTPVRRESELSLDGSDLGTNVRNGSGSSDTGITTMTPLDTEVFASMSPLDHVYDSINCQHLESKSSNSDEAGAAGTLLASASIESGWLMSLYVHTTSQYSSAHL